MVAGRQPGDAGADRVDHARRLVSENDRQRARERAVGDAEIGVADAAVRHPHADLAGAGIADLDAGGDAERTGGRFEKSGLHWRQVVTPLGGYAVRP